MTRHLAFFAIIATLALVMIAAGHFVLFRGLARFLDISSPRSLVVLYAIGTILSLSFVLASLAAAFGFNTVTRWLYVASAVWLGTAYWLLIAVGVATLVGFLGAAIGLSLPTVLIGRVLLAAAVLTSAYGVAHSFDTRVTRYAITLPGLPPAWEGRTVAILADTHLGNVRNVAFAKKVAGIIAAEKPEMLLIAGDFFDGTPANFDELAAPFGELSLPHGTYFALGNHEEFVEPGTFVSPLERAGVTVLRDQAVVVDGLQVAGIDYSSGTDDASAARTLSGMGLDASLPSVLIKHAPDALDAVAAAGIDLQVSGHTHRGQVWPGGWVTDRIFSGYGYGMRARGPLTVITTSGAGTWGPPQRVGSDSEVVIVTLTRKDQ